MSHHAPFEIVHPGMASIPDTKHGKLEKVQGRPTKMILDYKDLSNEER